MQGESRAAVDAGTVILVPPGVPHVTLAEPGQTVRLLCFFPDPEIAPRTEELASEARI